MSTQLLPLPRLVPLGSPQSPPCHQPVLPSALLTLCGGGSSVWMWCLERVGSIPRGHKQKEIRWHPWEILSIRKLRYGQVWYYLQRVDRLDGCIVLWLLTTTMLCMVQWGLFHTTAQKPKVHLKAHPSFLFAKSRASLATVIKTHRHFLRLLVRKLLSLTFMLCQRKRLGLMVLLGPDLPGRDEVHAGGGDPYSSSCCAWLTPRAFLRLNIRSPMSRLSIPC